MKLVLKFETPWVRLVKLTMNAIATAGIGFYATSMAVCRDLPPVSNCISAATVLPLLGGTGDSPLVEARFNGMRGALFVSPQYGKFLVRNVSDDFWFPADRFVTEIGIDRQRKPAELTHVDSLQFGTLELHDLQAVIVDRTFPLKIGDLPIVGIIGRDFLSEYGLIELIDIPHNKLAFYHWDHDRCGSSGRLLGPSAHIAPLREDDSVDGKIADREVRVHFNPDLDRNIFPIQEISKFGSKPGAFSDGPQVVLKFIGTNRGALSKKLPVLVAGMPLPPQNFLVTENIEQISLGYDFFSTRTVMFDFSYNTFGAVDVSIPERLPPTHHLHFDSYNIAKVGVREGTGSLDKPDNEK